MTKVENKRLQRCVIRAETVIEEAVRFMDAAGEGILLLCKEDMSLQGVLTDGDIRRALIRDVPFSEPCISIANICPVTAPNSVTREEALRLMDQAKGFLVNQLPLLNEQKKVVGLLLRSDLTDRAHNGLSAVVMAGGLGKRLRPLTDDTPKPMLPIGNKPLLETVICQLRDVGVKQVSITTHYKGKKIREHFGDGAKYGINISYANENLPLGTAGALTLMKPPREPFLVINGDILTQVNFIAMFEFHFMHDADITVGVIRHKTKLPYGIIECEDVRVTAVKEKPDLHHLINAGIYVLNPCVLGYIPSETTFHMTNLIEVLLENNRRVISFPIHEYWMDIGHPSDYEKANDDYPLEFGMVGSGG